MALQLAFIISAQSRVLHWPEVCDSGELKIINSSSHNTTVWLQKFDPFLSIETEYPINAKTTLSLKIEKKLPEDRHAVLYFNSSLNLKASFHCGTSSYPATDIEGGVLTFKKTSPTHNKLWFQNLFTDNNKVKIELLDSAGRAKETIDLNLKSTQTAAYTLDKNQNWSFARISSSNRLASFLLTDNLSALADINAPQTSTIESSGRYFLVGPRDGDYDSFVVKIENPLLIEQARSFIKTPSAEKILFARIQKDHQGVNRNFNSPTRNFWSWSTTEVTGFGDFGSTACNGSPQLLEDRLDGWLNDPAKICFWSYRVKKELTPDEVASGKIVIMKP